MNGAREIDLERDQLESDQLSAVITNWGTYGFYPPTSALLNVKRAREIYLFIYLNLLLAIGGQGHSTVVQSVEYKGSKYWV